MEDSATPITPTASVNNLTSIVTNSSHPEHCQTNLQHIALMTDIFTVLVGLPVITKLLWITITSKKTRMDILNLNLAIFHNIQYFVCILDMICLCFFLDKRPTVVMFLFGYVQIGGPMNLSFICIERYVAVIHPTAYPLLKKYRCREVCAVAVWLVAVPTALTKVLIHDSASTVVRNVIDIASCGIMGVMVAVMIWCNVTVLRALKQSGPGRDKMHTVKKRACKTIGVISIIALSCYIPVIVMMRVQSFQITGSLYKCKIIPVSVFLFSVASVVHPVFYLSTQGKLFVCSKPAK